MTKIISLGGSIIVPNEVDVDFLKKFKDVVSDFVSSGDKVVIVTGGGSTARKYQNALADTIGNNQEAMDWMGISATHLNAFLVKSIFNDIAEEIIIENPTQSITFNKSVLLAGGWKPGWSTDMDAVLLADNLKADTVINMSNIDYVYDKDPKLGNANKIKELTWDELLEITGTEWKPIIVVIAKPFNNPAPAFIKGNIATKVVKYAAIIINEAFFIRSFQLKAIELSPLIVSSVRTIKWSTPVPTAMIIPAIAARSRFQPINDATPKIITTCEMVVINIGKATWSFLYLR